MIRAFVASIGALALVTLLLAVVPAAVTTKTEIGAQAGPAPKTPWGEPNLQGIWTTDFDTPLQRPARYANEEFFSDEERAELDRQITGNLGKVNPLLKDSEQFSPYNVDIYTDHKPIGRRTSLIVDPPDGRIPPFTPEATKRIKTMREFELALLLATDICKNKLPGCEGGTYGPPSPRRAETPPYYLAAWGTSTGAINRADGPEDRDLRERCMGAFVPEINIDVGASSQIVQSPEAVTIFYETGQGQGFERVIPVTGRPHLPPGVRQWWGDSRGRWEDNTLVVDVTNFNPKTDFYGSHENLHLVERWTRRDANTLEYVVTIEDSTTWTKPWTVKEEYSKLSDQANRIFKEPRCHEGNFGMVGMLAGARNEERAFTEGRGPDPATRCTADCGGKGRPDAIRLR